MWFYGGYNYSGLVRQVSEREVNDNETSHSKAAVKNGTDEESPGKGSRIYRAPRIIKMAIINQFPTKPLQTNAHTQETRCHFMALQFRRYTS